MRFQDIFDSRTKHTDAWIDERQNTLLLTTPSKRKPSGRATQGVVTETVTANLSYGVNLCVASEVRLARFSGFLI